VSQTAYNLARLMVPIVIIGFGTGLGAVAFRKLITFFTHFFFTTFATWTASIYPVNIVLIPVIGALVFGPMIWKWAREARGHGVPEVMEAVALRGGKIRPVVAIVKSLASSIDIGSGGSVGREGPIAQIGSALGSTLGQLFHMPPRYLRLLVAAGAAGGISATFNAPLAGAIFAMEVILREWTPESFAACGTGAVLADIVALPFLGSRPYFVLPSGVGLHSPWELILFALLGLVAAVVGTGFTRILYWAEDRFNGWHFPEALKPAAGGLLLGILIVALPQVRGLGYNVMAFVFDQRLPLAILALYLVGKLLATSLTLGSGGSGGIFTPTLYMGSMLGGLFGLVSSGLFPHIVGPSAGYALVGAAAVFASASRAPITAVLIVMEMSQNYVLAVPLVLAVLVATRTSSLALEDSIYTLKLARRGVKLIQDTSVDVLQQITVHTAMTGPPPTIGPSAGLSEAADMLAEANVRLLAVMQEARLLGVVTVSDLEHARESLDEPLTAADVMVKDIIVAYPDEHLREVLRRMARANVDQLLVVDPANPEHLEGVIRRVDIMRALETQIGQVSTEPAFEALPHSRRRRGGFAEVELPPFSPLSHKALKDIRFPAGVVVVAVERAGRTVAPHGATLLLPDDHILLYVVPEDQKAAAVAFVEKGAPQRPPEAVDEPVTSQRTRVDEGTTHTPEDAER